MRRGTDSTQVSFQLKNFVKIQGASPWRVRGVNFNCGEKTLRYLSHAACHWFNSGTLSGMPFFFFYQKSKKKTKWFFVRSSKIKIPKPCLLSFYSFFDIFQAVNKGYGKQSPVETLHFLFYQFFSGNFFKKQNLRFSAHFSLLMLFYDIIPRHWPDQTEPVRWERRRTPEERRRCTCETPAPPHRGDGSVTPQSANPT